MTLPKLATRDRVTDAVLVISFGILQAAALAVAAFATRDAFAALHMGSALSSRTVIALSASGAIAAVCILLSRCRAEALGQSYAIALRRSLYAQIARLPKSRHEERRVGALSLRFVGDLSAARLWFGRGLPDVLSAGVVLPGAIAILFVLNAKLAFVGLVPLGFALIAMGALAWHLENRHRQLRQRRAKIAISMIERIAIAPELDLMGRTDKELRRLDDQGATLRRNAIARRGKTAGLQSALQLSVALSGLLMLWFASQNGIAPATVAASLSVLALVALPMQDMAAAWDHYCAWRVAREKAKRLLGEATVSRRPGRKSKPASVTATGRSAAKTLIFEARRGGVTTLSGDDAVGHARCIAGLDANPEIEVLFDGQTERPRIAYVGDTHVGLQGTLRRSATLISKKRPSDAEIAKTLAEFGLDELVYTPGGLDQRVAENGRNLTMEQTLRLDLARAVLGKPDVIVIASLRWSTDAQRVTLLETMRRLTAATIILADTANKHKTTENTEAT